MANTQGGQISGHLGKTAGSDPISKADRIMAFWASLSEGAIHNGKLFKGSHIFYVDTDAAAIGTTDHPDGALATDAGLTEKNMLFWRNEAGIARSSLTQELNPIVLRQHNAAPRQAPRCTTPKPSRHRTAYRPRTTFSRPTVAVS
ncbi:hypothetical protein [Tateyamaria sp. SN6-1]|uniref:hypothetical protein n=1 Tax=Tateyamaria sp. SN6-1 TaxID=3092148 RepID=UPI0039F593A8